ncbi:MAG: hypothetical protein IKO26_03285 [Paludibacteraceae bacterium]|nr:hypothetical protein [Paludibacteraceae bacterium]
MRTKICIILTVLFWTASSFAQTMSQKLNITIGGVTQTATLADNTATQELVNRLQNAPITVTLNSSGGFEIWGALGFSLPTSNQQINAQPGDIVLYNGSNICMFYGSNSWSYTRLGHIDGLSQSELQTFLHAGESNISVTLSLQNTSTGTEEVTERTQAVKVVRDGKIHIERNGYTYSIDGKRL